MAWPTITITTDNLSVSTATPAAARADLYATVQAVNNMIEGVDVALGVAGIDAGGKISSTVIPNTIESSVGSDLTLAPATTRVTIQDIINLSERSVTQLTAVSAEAGDVAYCSDGDAGSACLAVYTGSDWLRIPLGAAIATS